jgi:hypothetical protein
MRRKRRPSVDPTSAYDGNDPAGVAQRLTPWWREQLTALPEGDFPRPRWPSKRSIALSAAALSNAVVITVTAPGIIV